MDRNFLAPPTMWSTTVALRKESVDRNQNMSLRILILPGRSPQGERG